MIATLEKISGNLAGYLNNVLINREELLVSTINGNLIIIPEDDWNHINETLKLFEDKKSLKALLDGHNARNLNIEHKTYSFEEVFDDLQD